MPHNAIKCRLLQLYDRLVYKKTARRLHDGAALRVLFYKCFSCFLLALIGSVKERDDLRSCAVVAGAEQPVFEAVGHAAVGSRLRHRASESSRLPMRFFIMRPPSFDDSNCRISARPDRMKHLGIIPWVPTG